MNSLQIEYTKFLLQHNFFDIVNPEIKVHLEFYKRDLYTSEEFFGYEIQVNIGLLAKKVDIARKKGGLFLTKINDANFIKLNEFLLMNINLGFGIYKNFYKAVLDFKKHSYSSIRLYDIKQDSNSKLYYGIIVDTFCGNSTFTIIPLEKILFCFNTTRYWIL